MTQTMASLLQRLLFLACVATVWSQVCILQSPGCVNGGTCDSTNDVCQCLQGFTGSTCQFEIDFSLTSGITLQEDHGQLPLVISRTVTGYDMVLTITTTGTATASEDFILTTPSVTFSTTDTSRNIVIFTLDDDAAELDEDFSVVATVNGDGTVRNTNFIIAESDAVAVTISTTSFAESTGTANVVFSCIPPSGTNSADFTVTIADLTAIGADYTFTPDASYTCDSSTPITVAVSLTADNIPETDEAFVITLASTTVPFTINGATNSQVNILITDDDPLQISTSIPANVNEAPTSLDLTGTSFSFPNSVQASVTLTVTVAGGTAINNNDFTVSPSGPVTFTYDPTNPSSRAPLDVILITIVDDSIVEPDKTFTITFTSDYKLQGDTVTTITITDSDPEVITVTAPAGNSVNEDDVTATFTITRSTPVRGVTLTYAVIATPFDEALYNHNVQEDSGTITFEVGEPMKTLVVNLIDDQKVEIAKRFTVTLSGSLVQPIADTLVDIVEDDTYLVTTTGGEVTEGDFIRVAFTRDSVVGTVNFEVSTSDGIAVGGEDYIQQSTTLSFGENIRNVILDIQTTEDTIYEDRETFTISIADNPSLNAASFDPTTITIIDDDVEVLTITQGQSVRVDESQGTVDVTITRTTTFEDLTVMISTIIPSDGNPITADDITMQTGISLTFTAVDTVNFQVSIEDDAIAEPDEQFIVRVTPPGAIEVVEITVTIADNDPDVVTVTSFLAENENGGQAKITTSRTVSQDEVVVQVNTNDVTAKAGTDYTALSNHDVTFAAGSLTATFTVDLQDDEDEEGDETFTLVVSGTNVLTSDTYTFIIVEDEGSRPFDCRRKNQDCAETTDKCYPGVPVCECVGLPAREGQMCNIITGQKGGAACVSRDCNSNGVCLDDSGTTSCACYPGYYGDDCEMEFLQAACSSDELTLFANPVGNFGGKIYVKGKYGVNDCTANVIPDPPEPDDNIDDNLKGLHLTVPHDSATCEVISPQEGATETSYSRMFMIQYDENVNTGIDQLVTVSCTFNKDNLLINAGIATVDPDGPFREESATNTFSPLTVGVDQNGEPVAEADTIPLARRLCVTLRIPQVFGGLEIIDIEFNNSLPDDPLLWRVYTAGCEEEDSEAVLANSPFYLEVGNKRIIKFCFFAFTFVNSRRVTCQVKVKICVNPDDCDLGSCETRRKRQVTSSREATVGATFNIIEPLTQAGQTTKDQTDTNATEVIREQVCQLPLEFVPTVLGLGVVVVILVILCLYLTYRLVRQTKKEKEKPHVSFR